MALSSHRWHTIAESQFPWERDALDYLRERLPDQEPFRAWSNFEFIADDGSIYEVDLVVLTPAGFLLIEIKSQPGTVEGDVHTWIWKDVGRESVTDNPIILANQKAKKLASLLKRQPALNRIRAPFLEAAVFCSAPGIRIKLAGPAALNVYERDRGTEETRLQGIIARLTAAPDPTRSGGRVDGNTAKAIARAMEQAGIRPSNRSRRIGDYELGSLLFQGPAYQDYEAAHVALKGVKRRVRLYPIPLGASPSDRETIRRAAQREFQILEGIHHPGLLRALEYKDHERGAALIFEHDPDAIRLDHFVQQNGPRLGVEHRLALLRQIAETVQYAHEKKLVHRALSPQSILISSPLSLLPRAQILNWQSGYRDAIGSTSSTPRRVTGTSHLEALVEDAATVYMAPEASRVDGTSGEHVDVFSLGAVAYFLFSGQPPGASSLEVSEKLRESKGLRLSSAIDGASRELEELIQFSTHPEVSSRLDSAKDFTEWLTRVDAELTTPEEDVVLNPAEAKSGDRLRHGFIVKARLGRGSTAVALLVERDAATQVLKVASDPANNERLHDEAEVLRKLRHQYVVRLDDELDFDGRVGLLMERAGQQTLAQRLRQEGPLHLELLQRFGDDLLTTVDWLEQQGIPHRDIKPENVGIAKIGRADQLHLVLFDFSLSRTPPEAITAGTVRPTELPHLTFGDGKRKTVRYFTDKLPIGLAADGRRHVFLYLVNRKTPVDFRAFLHRHGDVLRAVPEWEIRLLMPSHFTTALDLYEEAASEEMRRPLRLSQTEEISWYFTQRSRVDRGAAPEDFGRFRRAERAFRGPRYQALYRQWRTHGEWPVQATASPVLDDKMSGGRGNVTRLPLTHAYARIAPMVGSA